MCCTQYVSKFRKLSSGHRTGKGPFSFQSQRKAMPKNAQTTTQLHSSHTLKILQARLQQYVNRELPDVQAGFRKGRGTRDQIANIHWIIEKAREFQKNIYFCFIDYAKAFDCVLLPCRCGSGVDIVINIRNLPELSWEDTQGFFLCGLHPKGPYECNILTVEV